MPAVSITDLNNAKQDVDHIAAFATSSSLTATDRLGNTKQTIAGVLAEIGDITEALANAEIYASNALIFRNQAESFFNRIYLGAY